MFVICDADCRIVTIAGIRLFGVKVDIPAAFNTEKDALDVLFAMEDGQVLKGHTVREVTHMTGAA